MGFYRTPARAVAFKNCRLTLPGRGASPPPKPCPKTPRSCRASRAAWHVGWAGGTAAVVLLLLGDPRLPPPLRIGFEQATAALGSLQTGALLCAVHYPPPVMVQHSMGVDITIILGVLLAVDQEHWRAAFSLLWTPWSLLRFPAWLPAGSNDYTFPTGRVAHRSIEQHCLCPVGTVYAASPNRAAWHYALRTPRRLLCHLPYWCAACAWHLLNLVILVYAGILSRW